MESMRNGHSPLRRGLLAGAATLAVGGVIVGVGVAGAAQDTTIYIAEAGGPCFTTTQGNPACTPGETVSVTIQTGDTVNWDFTGTAEGSLHNAKAANDVAGDPTWKNYAS